ncbi:MAG: hypothetical protein C5B50_12290 [Verrucomicrobia bacterium]|nr:MAG: hypothetical protein C5B50_12290 [Verrucomicrobiota bacterium]
MSWYLPNHKVTLNYASGMLAIHRQQLGDALDILAAEPADSPCYGLALANKALVELRLERYAVAENTGRMAITEFDTAGCPHPPTWVQTIRNLGESISLQHRLDESLRVFNDACHKAKNLTQRYPAFADDICLEEAHTFNSWGGALLRLRQPGDAVDCLTSARDIYRRYPQNQIGLPETLTNLAQAYTEVGKRTEAALAITEATELAGEDIDQIYRAKIAGARLGLFSKEVARQTLLDAANHAERGGYLETAYLRHCIAAYLADKENDPFWGSEVVQLAEALEPRLSQDSLHPAQLRFYKAVFRERYGASDAEVLNVLLEGARMWCERLPGRLQVRDYQAMVGLMHDHFRKLSAAMLTVGRNEEAFIAFEIGRARGFALERNKGQQDPILSANPFRTNPMDLTMVREIQDGLTENEVFASVAVLPPSLVAFIISKQTITVRAVDLVSNLQEADSFAATLDSIPKQVENQRGIDCIPEQVVAITRELVQAVGDKKIVLLAPHALLHKVPWRTLLRSLGAQWSQLPYITQFSPVFGSIDRRAEADLPKAAIALGFGTTGTSTAPLDLEHEAREFAAIFGDHGQAIGAARSKDLAQALESNRLVLISCHGNIVDREPRPEFLLQLADGGHSVQEIIENTVNAPLVILSACVSGAYEMAEGDYPVGAAPFVLLAGAKFCICTRFRIDAYFTKLFFPTLGRLLNAGVPLGQAFANALETMERDGYDMWRHLSYIELLGRGAVQIGTGREQSAGARS